MLADILSVLNDIDPLSELSDDLACTIRSMIITKRAESDPDLMSLTGTAQRLLKGHDGEPLGHLPITKNCIPPYATGATQVNRRVRRETMLNRIERLGSPTEAYIGDLYQGICARQLALIVLDEEERPNWIAAVNWWNPDHARYALISTHAPAKIDILTDPIPNYVYNQEDQEVIVWLSRLAAGKDISYIPSLLYNPYEQKQAFDQFYQRWYRFAKGQFPSITLFELSALLSYYGKHLIIAPYTLSFLERTKRETHNMQD